MRAGFVTGGNSEDSVKAEEIKLRMGELFRCPKVRTTRCSPDLFQKF
jgi:hypothetical protein